MNTIEKLKAWEKVGKMRTQAVASFSAYMPKEVAQKIIDALMEVLTPEFEAHAKEEKMHGLIKDEIYKAFSFLGAKSDLLSTIGSWRDTMTDEWTLDNLKLLNEHYSKIAVDDGWKDWAGGICPVHNHTIVEVRLRDGDFRKMCAENFRWHYLGAEFAYGDIIAYRIIQPAADRVEES